MRYFTLSLLALLFFSACSSYQYMTVNSAQLKKNDQHQLVFENDTLSLTYDFNGKDGPVSINILNKTSEPLYVNWKKSALIRDEHPLSYFDPRVPFSAGATSYNSRYVSNASLHGTFTLPEGVAFIPPGSSISKELVYLAQSGPTVLLLPDSLKPQKLSGTYGMDVKYLQNHYDEFGSPIKFKSYLTFTIGLNNTLEFAESCDFYVSEVIDTKTAPVDFTLYQQQGDKFFFKYSKQP